MITQDEYLKREIALWGEEYIFDLIDRGFTLILTSDGWKWVLPQLVRVDTERVLCYAPSVG